MPDHQSNLFFRNTSLTHPCRTMTTENFRARLPICKIKGFRLLIHLPTTSSSWTTFLSVNAAVLPTWALALTCSLPRSTEIQVPCISLWSDLGVAHRLSAFHSLSQLSTLSEPYNILFMVVEDSGFLMFLARDPFLKMNPLYKTARNSIALLHGYLKNLIL